MPPQSYDQIDPSDQKTQIALLAMRVENLGREKESLEEDLDQERAERLNYEKETELRLANIEKSFQKGAGIIMVFPILAGGIGLLIAYGKKIFAPWQ